MANKKSKSDTLSKLLFGDEDSFDSPVIPDEECDEIVIINTEQITAEAKCDAFNMMEDLMKVYGDEKFMKEHPDYKKRLDIEMNNLTDLIRMKRADNEVHDILVRAIGKDPTNASLYSSLNKMQSSILSIQKQQNEIIEKLNNLLKNYQFEIPVKEETVTFDQNTAESNHTGIICRGRKEFIKNLNEVEKGDQKAV